MSTLTALADTSVSSDEEVPTSERGPASTRVVVTYGFWLFLLSDIVMFAAFFASYSVLHGHTADGPSGRELFHRDKVLIETACLLFVELFTCAHVLDRSSSSDRQNKLATFASGLVTLALGATFLALEASEFATMLANGAGPSHSAFLSAFFALVGLHGVHVSIGIFWLIVMLAQIATLGFAPEVVRAHAVLQPVLARARHRLDRRVHHRVPGSVHMNEAIDKKSVPDDAPGDGSDLRISLWKYAAGLGLSVVLTLASFWVSGSDAVWSQGIPVLLAALAIGQMGVHLVFLPACLQRTRGHQQHPCAGLRGVRGGTGGVRFNDHHGQPRRKHVIRATYGAPELQICKLVVRVHKASTSAFGQ